MTDLYTTDDAHGDNWHLMLGDSCERLTEIPDDSVHLSVYSPPFASLFTYSPSPRDLGNSASRAEFFAHYGFIIRENLRVTMPGRIACVHVQQLTTSKASHGVVGLTDFRGEVIRAYMDAGWIFHGEVTVNKDPQAQAIRTKAQALMFVTKNRDSSKTRSALADYLLLFRKPGDNPVPIKTDVSNEEWIDWAQPVWLDIKETNTLNARAGREEADERHICLARGSLVLTRQHGYIPIQDVEPGDLVLTHMGRWMPVTGRRCNGVVPVIRTCAQGVADLRTTPDHMLWTRKASGAHAKRAAQAAIPGWAPAESTLGSYLNLKLPPVEDDALTMDEWWVVGRWLGDGHRGGHRRSGTRGGHGQFIISCSHDEAPALIQRLGVHAGHVAKVTATQIALIGLRDEVLDVLSRCGSGAAGKRVPGEAATLSVEKSDALLSGYLSADGHFVKRHERWQSSSVSRALLLGMAMVAQRARGAVASVYAGRPARDGEIQGRKVSMSQDWVLTFREFPGYRQSGWVASDGAWKKVRTIDDVGEAEVWDLTVAGDSSFTAEGAVVHNCPLQLDFIERCVRLWSNPGETVLSPFAGIGSEVWTARKLGRRGVGCELKPSYWRTAVENLRRLDADMDTPALLDLDGLVAS
jgi:hypothetical protein